MRLPFVSWVCNTYQREEYLPRIIKCFLNQDYPGRKEFVILNDDHDVWYEPSERLVREGVRIFNWEYRFKDLEQKRRTCIDKTKGELLMQIGDDDIYEHWAISTFVREIKDYPFIACCGFLKTASTVPVSVTFCDKSIYSLHMAKKDYYIKLGGNDAGLHNFTIKVSKTDDYREFNVEEDEAFMTWDRTSSRGIWDMSDEKKFEIKKIPNKRVEIDLMDKSIHRSVKIGENVTIGCGTIIEKGCEIKANTFIGNNCVLRPYTKIGKTSSIGHGTVIEGWTEIGSKVSIQAQCHITKNMLIEDYVFIGPSCVTTNDNNLAHERELGTVLEGPKIRYGARIGGSVSIKPGLEIGKNAVIGIGSVVTKNIPEKQVWYGNPARYIRDVPEGELL